MKKKLAAVAKKYGISMMIQFGSSVTGRLHPESDIDIAIAARPMKLRSELLLRWELSKLFKREIDLAFLSDASPLLLGQVARHGKLIFGSRKTFVSFRVEAMKKYFDFQPYFQLREKLLHRTISKYAG